MSVVALADFGSTYTKVRLVDPDEGRLLARAEAPTSIGTDLMEGYAAALGGRHGVSSAGRSTIDGRAGRLQRRRRPAGGGGGPRRRPDRGRRRDQAALNAGARVEAVLAGSLGEEQLDELQAARPEIVLFAGGTDGGQAELVVENARRLAARGLGGYAVVACNADVAEEAAGLLRAAAAPRPRSPAT